MKRTQELFEKIDAYLDNTLEDIELSVFLEDLKNNEALEQEVIKHKRIRYALQDQKSIDFRNKLKQIDGEIEVAKSNDMVSRKNYNPYLKFAAIFMILIGISSFLWFLNPVKEDLFIAYYLPYPVNDLTRGTEISDSDLEKLSSNYASKQYQKSIPILESLLVKKPDNDTFKLYLGNCYLNTNQEEKAILLFKSFLIGNEFYEDAQWFLGLSYVKIKDKTKAKKIMNHIISYENLYKRKALKLLKELDKG